LIVPLVEKHPNKIDLQRMEFTGRKVVTKNIDIFTLLFGLPFFKILEVIDIIVDSGQSFSFA
jgi:hypothetical protein